MKKVFIGILAVFVVMIATNAQAAVNSYIGKKIEGQFNVTVNGKQITDQAIVIEGKSYLPTRAIAETFNAEVKFDAKSGINLVTENQVTETQGDGKMNSNYLAEIESLEDTIEFHQNKIKEYNMKLELDHNLSEEAKTNLQNGLIKAQEIIDNLEAKKAELEAQLTKTP